MSKKKSINKQMFLEDLPTKIHKGKKVIDWKKSVGYKVNGIYDDIIFETDIVGYVAKKEKSYLYIKYQDKELFEIQTLSFQKCQIGKLLGRITDEFKVEIGQTFKDGKRDITILDRRYEKDKNGINRKYYKYRCNKCGFECGEHYVNGEYKDEHWIEEGGLLSGKGCACCCNPCKIVVPCINDIPTTAPWMIKFFQGGCDEAKKYTYSSNKRIKPICPECGRVKDKEIAIYSIYNHKTISCICGDGVKYPEKFMFNMLEQLNINFETQYSPEWIGLMRYDFYFELDNNKYIVETDGGLGHGKSVHSKSNKTTRETMRDDEYKDFMAKQYNIKIIRVDCDESEMEHIKNNILSSELNTMFDLSKIDWSKCEEFALKSRVKEACELKRDNPDMTTREIGEVMKLNRNTITKYLKQGSKIWDWINYNKEEEKFKSIVKTGKKNGKTIEILKDGISLGIFESTIEIERKSEELFGIRLNHSNISSVCLGMYKHYKGFTFKYV